MRLAPLLAALLVPAPCLAAPAPAAPKHVATTADAALITFDDDEPPAVADRAPSSSGPATAVPSAATTNLAAGSPVPAAPAPARKWVELYGAIAGGLNYESLHEPATNTGQAQHPTVAISRLGVRGGFGPHITFASELEASLGGPMGYGASVWEGEAAIAIWDQYVRYQNHGWSFTVGRLTDAASIDFFSEHIADLLLADEYTRDPILYAGADRGNGVAGSYALTDHLMAGLTLHSTNPTGISGTLVIGGKLSPFERPFYLASAQVGTSAGNLPDQNLHVYFGSPALVYRSDVLDANAEIQVYDLDTQVSTMADQTIRGYNLRAGARAKIALSPGTRLAPFVNLSRNVNEILDTTAKEYRLPELYHSFEVSTGVDYNYSKRNGVGFEYALVDSREPDQHELQHYLNVGTTFWIEDALSIGVRASVFAAQVSGAPMTTGNRSLFVTARLTLD